MSTRIPQPVIRNLGRVDYEPTWHRMQAFTDQRGPATPDELWFLEHPPVFTQGQNGLPEHLLAPGSIPVVPVDRGGQVTYHGPGQWVVYPLVDITRLDLGIRGLVTRLENSMIRVLEAYGVAGHARRDAPGVYVGDAKIGSIGLRVRRGCSYHGIAFNVDLDLEPFGRINPCGYTGLRMTRLADLADGVDMQRVRGQLEDALLAELGYREHAPA